MTRVVPTITQESPGNYLTAALWNSSVYELGNFSLTPPLFYGYQAAAQALSSGNWVAIGIDTAIYDSDSGHSNSVNTTRYTAQVAGRYRIDGGVTFASNSTGNRAARLELNGAPIMGACVFEANPTGNACGLQVSYITYLNVGDYVEVYGLQISGGSLNTYPSTNGDLACYLAAQWVSI